LGAASQVARSPIHGMQHVGHSWFGLWEIATLGPLWMVNQMGIVQDTFDGCQRGNPLEQVCLAQFVLDRLWAAQTDASLPQALTGGYNEIANVVGVASAEVQWRAGARAQALPALLVEAA